REARPPVHGVPRGGVRNRRPVHGSACQTRRRRRRRDCEAATGARREEVAARVGRSRARGRRRLEEEVAMDLGLNGRTAIVCGAWTGMGLGIAESLRSEGANVVMFARREELLRREAERIGGLAAVGDVRSPDDLERLVNTTVDTYGGVDILVNNSGGP